MRFSSKTLKRKWKQQQLAEQCDEMFWLDNEDFSSRTLSQGLCKKNAL